jgi:serine phosphatase RsbU (regulator of sigma subunit)/pSer/pThr/pTyr-binding forkhead associated (FHA) protein
MPTLVLLTGDRAGTRWPILGDRFSIGRDPGCDAVIGTSDAASGAAPADPAPRGDAVSRRQALITHGGGQWYIQDGDQKKSRNGTFVNDQKLPFPGRRLLRGRDRIRVCDIRLEFQPDPESTFDAETSLSHADSGPCLDSQPADRLRLLLAVSAALRGTLDPDAILDRTLEHLFRLFPRAERGLVVFREEPTGPLVVRALRTPRGGPADPAFSTCVVRRCLERVEALLGNDLPAQFPDSESIGELSVRSLMCTPLWTPDGQALGVVQLDTRADGRKFTPDDLRLLLGVAGQASMALGNARLHRESLAHQRRARNLEVAQQVQRALLPGAVPDVPGYEFHAHYAAADEVGGDYYDFVPLPGGRLAVLLGDVSGHGVAAALVMARFGAQARACLEEEDDPALAVARLNDLVVRAAVPGSFVTLAVVVIDPTAHTLAVVNAGHPSPLLRRADGDVVEVASPDESGMALGMADAQHYACSEVRLGPGESVLLFSDGVTEAAGSGDRQFGMEGVLGVLSAEGHSPRATGEALAAAVRRHAAGLEQGDDITLVCFGRVPV